jgi:hypothetical protein
MTNMGPQYSQSEAGENLSDASTTPKDDEEARDVQDGEAAHAQAVNSRVLQARRLALEKCARNTGATFSDGGCQALEHTSAVRGIAHNSGEKDIKLIWMNMASYGFKRLLIEYAGMGRGNREEKYGL